MVSRNAHWISIVLAAVLFSVGVGLHYSAGEGFISAGGCFLFIGAFRAIENSA